MYRQFFACFKIHSPVAGYHAVHSHYIIVLLHLHHSVASRNKNECCSWPTQVYFNIFYLRAYIASLDTYRLASFVEERRSRIVKARNKIMLNDRRPR